MKASTTGNSCCAVARSASTAWFRLALIEIGVKRVSIASATVTPFSACCATLICASPAAAM